MTGDSNMNYRIEIGDSDEDLANGLDAIYDNIREATATAQAFANHDPDNTIQDKVAIMMKYLYSINELTALNFDALKDIILHKAQGERDNGTY